jgi:hypothetical protein
VVLALAVLATSTWMLAEPAAACLCQEQTPAEPVVGAEVAFIGTVVGRDDGDGEASPPDLPVVTYEVERVFAGEVPPRVEVMTTGTDCNSYTLEGQRGLVVAADEMEHPQRELAADQVADLDCAGTRPLPDGAQTPAGLGAGTPPTPLPPGSSSNDLPWLFLGAMTFVLTSVALIVLVRERREPEPWRAPASVRRPRWEDGVDEG